MSARPPPERRAGYSAFRTIATRWMDNDAYGHVNNVVYYSFIDTAVNQHLIEAGWLDIARSQVIGLVVETGCRFFRPVAFPDAITAGLRVAQAGTSSVRYEVGLFKGEDETASAQGHLVHVYVDRATSRPVPLPDDLRSVLASLKAEPAQPEAGRDP